MFEIRKNTGERRLGKIITKNGEIKTPFFMPDATRGFVKFLGNADLISSGTGSVVVNTYHLFLQPGMEIIKKAGGIHKFMNWKNPILSDSGGYQVFSLIHKNPKMGKITEDEVIFKSPLDGKKHTLTPEKAIEIQFDLGVDMMVVLDDPPPNSYSKKKTLAAVERTIRWAKRCKVEYKKQTEKRKISAKDKPLLFGVIQGGEYLDIRKYCAEELIKIGFDGYGFGGRHLDKDGNFMEEMVRQTARFIPEKSLRFALGVGTPEDIVKLYSFGWDMFDCVIPTREGRHGRLFLWKEKGGGLSYETINITNEKHGADFSPVDAKCACMLCKNHTRSYLNHLFRLRDPLGGRLAAVHNLKFYMELMNKLGNKCLAVRQAK